MHRRWLLCLLLAHTVLGDDGTVESTTEPDWAPTGKLNQFAGFGTPRPQLLPAHAQMVWASVWAAWSSWSFCAGGERIRVRACNTIRGFRCLGPNQETQPCDASVVPALPRRNSISNDYDVSDPWQEDRIEALRQLYPDDLADQAPNSKFQGKHQKLRAGEVPKLTPPNLVSHELLHRPTNDADGAPGSTPERIFGAKQFAVKTASGRINLPLPVPSVDPEAQDFGDITREVKLPESQKSKESFRPFLTRADDVDAPSKKDLHASLATKELTETKALDEHKHTPKFDMKGPQFTGKQFTEDVFGNIDDLTQFNLVDDDSKTKKEDSRSTFVSSTTTEAPKTTTSEFSPTPTTTASTTAVSQTVATTTQKINLPPQIVTPKTPVSEDLFFEVVTPATSSPNIAIPLQNEPPMTTKYDKKREKTVKKVKSLSTLHFGEVPLPSRKEKEKALPELSADTLSALDWMLKNITQAAKMAEKNELSETRHGEGVTSRKSDQSHASVQLLNTAKVLRKTKKRRGIKGGKRTRNPKLHDGGFDFTPKIKAQFPRFRTRAHKRQKIFGIRTMLSKEINFPNSNQSTMTQFAMSPASPKKPADSASKLVEEINELQSLMDDIDSRIESRSRVVPRSFSIQHEHDERQ
ncbi:unnamed protein product [Caenorhabditis auriculariae]|uniref:Uncharacterized protein n=1 Tax=Caenorhabditis auriculariae TaxID=2777116 RepID=A0A8S1GN21_9PELO|nr:unnamed protein product [Caenorhabditis auriculariae]